MMEHNKSSVHMLFLPKNSYNKLLRIKFYRLITTLSLIIAIFAPNFSLKLKAEISEKDHGIIRYHIKNREYSNAKNLIQQLSIVNINDPQLELLSTEILILEAEEDYNKGLYKSSYEKFSHASEVWSTHQLVQQRIQELSARKLIDIPNRKSTTNPHINSSELSDLADAIRDQNEFLQSRISFLEEMVTEQHKMIRYTITTIAGSFVLFLIGIALLFRFRNQK
ncbi:hypothetical protein [Leptospira sp. GIMC2001]|uniref:hypothetical protein n=1 Tax=Leptospira sp. GIMC2001 TaxID=1513297 RepID=UPI00234B7870|nr:hypothetical protein [Leptospira sp. GIMC2001]WCL48111.1 hypothetical protein O4O04_12385 [Leptospira sp. GIMC2001]